MRWDGGGQQFNISHKGRTEKCKNALCTQLLEISHKFYISIAIFAAGSTHHHPRPLHVSQITRVRSVVVFGWGRARCFLNTVGRRRAVMDEPYLCIAAG